MAGNEGGVGVGSLQLTQNDILSHGVDIFEPTKQERAVLEGREIMVRPTCLRSEGPFEFIVPSQGGTYMQMGSFRLWGKCRILDADGADGILAGNTVWAPVNLFPASLFRSIEVQLNGQPVAQLGSNCHHYKQYIETLLSYGEDARLGHLQSAMFLMDTAGVFDTLADNDGALSRAIPCRESRIFDWEIPVASDFLQSDRYLPPGNNLTIKFNRNYDPFSLMVGANHRLSIEFVDLKMFYRVLTLHPGVSAFHRTEWMERGREIIIPFKRTQLVTWNIPQNSLDAQCGPIFNGHMPNMIVVGMVSTAAFNGSYATNPFNFQHFFCKKINVRYQGKSIPSEPYQPDFRNNLFAREYNGLFQNTGIKISNDGNCITKSYFAGGCYLQAFDLTADNCAGFHQHPPEDGSLYVEIEFARELTHGITVIIYGVFYGEVCINSDKAASTHNLKKRPGLANVDE